MNLHGDFAQAIHTERHVLGLAGQPVRMERPADVSYLERMQWFFSISSPARSGMLRNGDICRGRAGA